MASNTPNLDLLMKDPVLDKKNTFNIQTMLNDNWEKIDTSYGNLKTKTDNLNSQMADIVTYSTYKMNKDLNNKYTEVQIKRADGTLYKKSILTGGISPNYTTRTETEYQADGTTIKATRVYALTYDAEGKIESEVLQQ